MITPDVDTPGEPHRQKRSDETAPYDEASDHRLAGSDFRFRIFHSWQSARPTSPSWPLGKPDWIEQGPGPLRPTTISSDQGACTLTDIRLGELGDQKCDGGARLEATPLI